MDKRISLKKIMEQATQEFIVANVFVYGGGGLIGERLPTHMILIVGIVKSGLNAFGRFIAKQLGATK